ncbi:hypothetical protein FH972_008553 [Carpinus fangiana]|uniref:Uncharacterized protein n=1 Tax=Carpinus fangiana TaxID=176857 RepID=A0A5N6QZ41_9ROSI|nr:hypothetical protein FH972_008553 [Carpinus fangiana]
MGSDEHIVMLPYLAHGHLIPFLALAKQLQRRTGFTITIASTKLNIYSDHDLPPNTENTENLPPNKIVNLFHASLSLKDPFRCLVRDIIDQEGRLPLCIISDVFFGWAVEVATSVGTVNVTFTTSGAYGTMAYISLWLNLPHHSTDFDEFPLPGFPESHRFHRSQLHPFLRAADGADVWSTFMQSQISHCLESCGWLCNSVVEIEPFGLQLLKKYLKLPVWTIYEHPSSSSRSTIRDEGEERGSSVKALDDFVRTILLQTFLFDG